MLERELADLRAELDATIRERDALSAQLAVAIAELSALDKPVATPEPAMPPPPERHATGAAEPRFVIAEAPEPSLPGELSRVVVSAPATAPEEDDSRPSGAERRRKARHAGEFEVEFLSETHFTSGLTQDLSEGGVFVATYQQVPIGTKVALTFELPGEHRVEANGEVRWIREERGDTRPGLGIAFTHLNGEALQRITAFCAATPSRYYEV